MYSDTNSNNLDLASDFANSDPNSTYFHSAFSWLEKPNINLNLNKYLKNFQQKQVFLHHFFHEFLTYDGNFYK